MYARKRLNTAVILDLMRVRGTLEKSCASLASLDNIRISFFCSYSVHFEQEKKKSKRNYGATSKTCESIVREFFNALEKFRMNCSLFNKLLFYPLRNRENEILTARHSSRPAFRDILKNGSRSWASDTYANPHGTGKGEKKEGVENKWMNNENATAWKSLLGWSRLALVGTPSPLASCGPIQAKWCTR